MSVHLHITVCVLCSNDNLIKLLSFRPKIKSLVSGHWSASKLVRRRIFIIFFCNNFCWGGQRGNVWYTYTRGPNFPKYGGWERHHKLGKRSDPYAKKPLKIQYRGIPIDPAILAVIGHRFIAKTENTKMPTRGDQKWDNLLALYSGFSKGSTLLPFHYHWV